MREIGAAGLLLLGLITLPLSGCVCDAQEVEFDVALARDSEMARTLPMLASGKTNVVGIPLAIPDSHGHLDLKVDIPHPNITRVEVSKARALLTVGGASVPVRITAVDADGRWSEDPEERIWSGSLEDGETARFWWTVDRERTSKITQLLLAEGKPYSLNVRLDWRVADCSFKASGSVDQTYDGLVRASVNAKTFAPSAGAMVEAKDGTVGFRANYTITSGVTINLESSSALAVILSPDAMAAAVIPKVSWTVNGLPGSAVKPTDKLATFSASATNPTVYVRSGNVVPPGSPSAGTLVVLVQDLTYRATDGSLGTVADTFVFAKAN